MKTTDAYNGNTVKNVTVNFKPSYGYYFSPTPQILEGEYRTHKDLKLHLKGCKEQIKELGLVLVLGEGLNQGQQRDISRLIKRISE